jgi:hypothetical protein
MKVYLAFRNVTTLDGEAALKLCLGVFRSARGARRFVKQDSENPSLRQATRLLGSIVSYNIREEVLKK